MRNKVIAVLRDNRYCPKGIGIDNAILEAVAECIKVDRFIGEARLSPNDLTSTDTLVLSMGRLPSTLSLLKTFQAGGGKVVNTPDAVEICTRRTRLRQIMKACGVALPSEQGAVSWWLKRGDNGAHGPHDVVFCRDARQLHEVQKAFQERGITEWVVSPHVEGVSVKFYGVGRHLFRCYTDDGQEIDADALRLELDDLRENVMRIVDAVHIDVYGGDCIVDQSGRFYIIDFNDWPSFRFCTSDAAAAIVSLIHPFLIEN